MKLHEKIIITGELELLTGLHIGDSKDNVEIGGVDNPVVRRKDNNQPYIPGSSLKGKMRALLEIATGTNANNDFKKNAYKNKENKKYIDEENGQYIPLLFGSAGDDGNPSRIIVRDAYLTEEWAKNLAESEFTDMPYTEIKFENVINRIKGTAEHPRQIERVPAGAKFNVEFVINIFEEEKENEDKYLNLLKSAIKLLEDDYLGGSGSRGYGKVKFYVNIDNANKKKIDEYFNSNTNT